MIEREQLCKLGIIKKKIELIQNWYGLCLVECLLSVSPFIEGFREGK